MEYLEFKIECTEHFREILIAELSEIGFDAFLETETGIDAYIQEDLLDKENFNAIIEKYQEPASLSLTEGKMEKVNWNEEWEKHYDPITVENQVYVRASFHAPRSEFPHEILINPKMSFGTGHHATTYLMISHLLEADVNGKKVIDIGSGTGILAIMAHKLGASMVEAFDIDEWCVENGNENFSLNDISFIKMGLGTIREINPEGPYDIVLANINKNVLLDEMEIYANLLTQKGKLFLSGFYEQDVEDISYKAKQHHLRLENKKVRDNWTALTFEKQ